MKELLGQVLMMTIGSAAIGVACETYEHQWRDGFETGKRLAHDYALAHAISGKPWKIKLFDGSEYIVTVSSAVITPKVKD